MTYEEIFMKTSKLQLTLGLVLACVFAFSLAVRAQAQTVTNFANFDGVDGHLPQGQTVVQATNGRFYGTTAFGGAYGMGNMYELTPGGKLSNFYSFCSLANCADGAGPAASPVLGIDGNLYGTTAGGGSDAVYPNGSGTVYKMTIEGEITTLYTFCPTAPCTDGSTPTGMIQASDGNLYGSTYFGGSDNAGTIFQLTPAGEFKLLHSFCSVADCADGDSPNFPPIQGNDGNFYGAGYDGGTGGGVFYELTASGTYTVLYDFCYTNFGDCPTGSLPNPIVQDASGNFFGTTNDGGSRDYGVAFEITAAHEYNVLQNFNYATTYNYEGLTLANDGNLYGSTLSAANESNAGTIVEITPEGVAREIYAFSNGGATGSEPWSPLFQATDGNLYGTTNYGGDKGGYGTVFKLSNGLSPLVKTVPVRGTVGTSVIILGNDLTGSTSVTFNGVEAKFTVESDSYIKATVPADASTGVVSVVTPSGTLKSNPQFVVSK
jgi:uncharacterized repeat protein (TIGR03803 family)